MSMILRVCVVLGGLLICFPAAAQPPVANAVKQTDQQPNFIQLDANGDGQLTLDELRAQDQKPDARLRFFRLDINEDGWLSSEEWGGQGRPSQASIASLFRGYDANEDGKITKEELLAPEPAQSHAALLQKLTVFDRDGDGAFSVEEFATVPGLVRLDQRGPIADPVQEIAAKTIDGLLNEIRLPLAMEDWKSAAEQKLPVTVPLDIQFWDGDGNGQVDADEIRRSLEIAYGLRRSDEGLNRHPDGRVFYGRYFLYLDRNLDRRLSAEEFAPYKDRYPAPIPEFPELDLNRDGFLDLAEMDAARLCLFDVAEDYLRWDSDRNGKLDAKEVRGQAREHERIIAGEILPAFDLDGDGVISLSEFRASLLGDPSRNWNQPSRDLNDDGAVDLKEFFPEAGLASSALAAYFFDRLDLNDDDRLTSDEARLQLDLEQFPVPFTQLDDDQDGKLTAQEFVDHSINRDARLRFVQRDMNEDGWLSPSEWEQPAVDFQPSVKSLFRGYDADEDGRIVKAELLAPALPEQHALLIQKLLVFDGNGDGSLSLEEFTTFPGLVRPEQRGALTDPVADLAQATINKLLKGVSAPVPLERWKTAAPSQLPSSVPVDTRHWDHNENGLIDSKEIRRGLEIAYGLRRSDEGLNRLPDGRVFYGRYFLSLDRNGDGRLSAEEFAPYQERYPAPISEFLELDRNHDQFLDLSEIDQAQLFLLDIPEEFLRWDSDRNGRLDAKELRERSPDHQRNLAGEMLPAFDLDEDGLISLAEFRASPLGDASRNWNQPVRDLNGDGSVDLKEFFQEGILSNSALAAYFFDRLDLNHDGGLTSDEARLQLDLDHFPLPFAQLDTDHDGQVSSLEFGEHNANRNARLRFFCLDANQDGRLSPKEWENRTAQPPLARLFQGYDANANGQIDKAELLAPAPPETHPALLQKLMVFDQNRDEAFSIKEFSTVPGLVPLEQRGEISDPIAASTQERIEAVLKAISAPLAIDQWQTAAKPLLPVSIPISGKIWDRDGDGKVEAAELRLGLEIAYGLRRTDGGLNRHPDGQVFYGRYFQQLDRNADGQLSAEEFTGYKDRFATSVPEFGQLDQNKDEFLDLSEVDQARLFLLDVPEEFLRWDSDRNGRLDGKELQERARDHERHIASRLLPAFDRDGDGQISLMEFLGSPLGDASRNWNNPPRDLNGDESVDLKEFFPEESLAGSGMAALFFDRLDLNHDGRLTNHEIRLQLDLDRVAVPFDRLDSDHNRQVSLKEFTEHNANRNARLRFFSLDMNQDGWLSPEEWEQRSATTALPLARLFLSFDANEDGRIVKGELLAPNPPETHAALLQKLLVFDHDGDGAFSLTEFSTVPGLIPTEQRGELADPIRETAESRTKQMLAALSLPITLDQWQPAIENLLPSSIPRTPKLWDSNGDGQIDQEEVRHGLDVAYGIRRPDGGLNRHANGLVFYGRYFLQLDQNRDNRLSVEEFALYRKRYPQPPLEFGKLDRNGDGILDWAEIDEAQLCLLDIPAEFLNWDSDRNGKLSAKELRERAPDHQRNLASQLLPAFDMDGDGQISLQEFLGSPLGDASRSWNDPPRDLSGDGAVDPSEYFPDKVLTGSGMAALFFARLDRNHDGRLTRDEVRLELDLGRIPAIVMFAELDADQNESLSIAEAFSLPEKSQPSEVIYSRHLSLFQKSDRNGNGTIEVDELSASSALQAAISAERWARQSVLTEFQARDLDKNRHLSATELLAQVAPVHHSKLQRDLIVFDFNRDGQLSWEEYLSLYAQAMPARRGTIPDPEVDLAQKELAEFTKAAAKHDANGDHLMQRPEWEQAFAGAWYADWFAAFDQDQDVAVTPQEADQAFAEAFGIRHKGGLELRQEIGLHFNWRYPMLGWDADHDGSISRQEFLLGFSPDQKKSEAAFTSADQDGDGRITLAELTQIESLWVDVLGKFLASDTDLNGRLSSQELAANTQQWEQPYLPWLFPAFDNDGDGELDFSEFRQSPLGNFVLVWNRLRPKAGDDGQISLPEFHPLNDWAFLGLSRMLFDHLDRDHNGVLGINELDFDWSQVPAQLVLEAADRNGDQRLSRSEAFADAHGEGPRLLHPRHERLFDLCDLDGDGLIDLKSLDDLEPLAQAIKTERWLRRDIEPQLQQRDADHDGVLRLGELLQGVPTPQWERISADFQLFDSDQDGRLSFLEYAALSDSTLGNQHGLIHDPVMEEVERLWELVRQQLPKEGAPTADTARVITTLIPSVSANEIVNWDLDSSGSLTPAEVRQGLEVLYGVRHPSGALIRLPDGKQFYARSFRAWDQNANDQVEKQEFVSQYGSDKKAAEQLFATVDADQDGVLSIDESRAIPSLWPDSLQEFRRFDADHNAAISPQELSSHAKDWEKRNAALLFPVFDLDGNGALSFREFRLTPLGNPFAFWDRPRSDLDYDGRLSLQEFHQDRSPWLKGLSGMFLSRLDRNKDGYLNLEEIQFTVDLSKAPLTAAFTILDENSDQRLSLTEAARSGRTKPADPVARKHYEERIARIEDAFYLADKDHDGLLTIEEFSVPSATIAAYATGRSVPRPAGGRLPAQARSGVVTAGNSDSGSSWDLRFIGLVTFNVLLLGGLAWLVLRPGKG